MKIVAIIEARMDSSRLPKKILADILGKPMLEHIVNRIQKAKLVNQVMVATTVAPNDIETENTCKKIGIPCFRGSSEDVLNRVVNAAQSQNADIIVELNGDCPLLDPQIIDSVIQCYLENKVDCASNVVDRTFPRGLDTQVFSTASLAKVEAEATELVYRENPSLYFYEHPERMRLKNVAASPDVSRPEIRLTVDTEPDLKLIREIYTRLYPQNPAFSLKDVIQLLDAEPELKNLNSHIQQKKVR